MTVAPFPTVTTKCSKWTTMQNSEKKVKGFHWPHPRHEFPYIHVHTDRNIPDFHRCEAKQKWRHRSAWEECVVMWEGSPTPALVWLADLQEPSFFILFFSQAPAGRANSFLSRAGSVSHCPSASSNMKEGSITQSTGCLPRFSVRMLQYSQQDQPSQPALHSLPNASPKKDSSSSGMGPSWDWLELLMLMQMYFGWYWIRAECITLTAWWIRLY